MNLFPRRARPITSADAAETLFAWSRPTHLVATCLSALPGPGGLVFDVLAHVIEVLGDEEAASLLLWARKCPSRGFRSPEPRGDDS